MCAPKSGHLRTGCAAVLVPDPDLTLISTCAHVRIKLDRSNNMTLPGVVLLYPFLSVRLFAIVNLIDGVRSDVVEDDLGDVSHRPNRNLVSADQQDQLFPVQMIAII